MKSKYEIVSEETSGIFDEHETDITGLTNALRKYAKQVAIAFAEWINTEDYTKHSDMKWHTYGLYMKNNKSYTTEELFNKFLTEHKI